MKTTHFLATCEHAGWNLAKVAELLKVAPKTVYNVLDRLSQRGVVRRQAMGKWIIIAGEHPR